MNPSPQSTDRHIRMFVSSTFRDMQEERDVLIKNIFPQLRKLCEERAVTLTEVDLRWGITIEQVAEGQVLPLCLNEIDRCRPYFIGLLGERYGWVSEPDSLPIELLESQPWLRHCADHSVTALEILHGVFSDDSSHPRAYFYFRDSRYLESIPSEMRQDFTAENADAAGKLEKLKQKIRHACDKKICELREGYATPAQLGEWILEDFTALIDRLYPKDDTPDPIDQEAARHEAYARSRRFAFVGREDLLRRLNGHCTTVGKPLVLTGESGCGKSALMAEWVAGWRKGHSDDLIIQHYIGSTPDSADWKALVLRIVGELKRAFAITDEIPSQPDTLRRALHNWTVQAAQSRRVVLVLDALNQLAADDAAQQLGWLPVTFPGNFRVVVSSLPVGSGEALRKRDWQELNVPLFLESEVASAAVVYFDRFSKTLSKDLLASLKSTAAARNPLYLRAVLDELRQFGKHDELHATASDYLSASDPKALYERILGRWKRDFGSGLVRAALRYLWAARRGLLETEWLDLLGTPEGPLPRQAWLPLFLAMEPHLVQRAGLFAFGHSFLRDAVEAEFLPSATDQTDAHSDLAEYFGRMEAEFKPSVWDDMAVDRARSLVAQLHQLSGVGADLSPVFDSYRPPLRQVNGRVLHELPWQLARTKDWHGLRVLLADLMFLKNLWRARRIDVTTCWMLIEAHSSFRIVDAYKAVFEFPELLFDYAQVAVELLQAAHPREAYVALDRLLWSARAVRHSRLPDLLRLQASTLKLLGRPREALAALEESERFCESAGRGEDAYFSRMERASALLQLGDCDAAQVLLEEDERVLRSKGRMHDLGACLLNQGAALSALGRQDEAVAKLSEAELLSRHIEDVSLRQACLGELASLRIAAGDLESAQALLEEKIELCGESGEVRGGMFARVNLARIAALRDDRPSAVKLLQNVEDTARSLDAGEELATALFYHAATMLETPETGKEAYHLAEECYQLASARGLLRLSHSAKEILNQFRTTPDVEVAIAALSAGRQPASKEITYEAIDVLGRDRRDEATATILRCLESQDWITRLHAAKAYVRVNRGQGENGRPGLEALIEDPDESVRQAVLVSAKQLLLQTGTADENLKRQIDSIVERGRVDADEDVRGAAEELAGRRRELWGQRTWRRVR